MFDGSLQGDRRRSGSSARGRGDKAPALTGCTGRPRTKEQRQKTSAGNQPLRQGDRLEREWGRWARKASLGRWPSSWGARSPVKVRRGRPGRATSQAGDLRREGTQASEELEAAHGGSRSEDRLAGARQRSSGTGPTNAHVSWSAEGASRWELRLPTGTRPPPPQPPAALLHHRGLRGAATFPGDTGLDGLL